MMDAPVPPMDGAPVEAMADAAMADAADAELSDALADIQALDPSFDLDTMTDPVLANMDSEVPDLQGDAPVVHQTTAAGMAMGGQVTYITDIHNMSDEEYNKLVNQHAIPTDWKKRWLSEAQEDDGYKPLTEERFKSMAADIDRSHGGGPDYGGAALAIGLVVGLLVVVVGLAGAM